MKTTLHTTRSVESITDPTISINHTTGPFTEAAWRLCRAALWPAINIDAAIAANAKRFIDQYLHLQGYTPQSFNSFCTRILLAREYYEQYPQRLASPGDWLTADHDEGFTLTLLWYQDLLFRRQHSASFRADIEMFASAYAQFAQNSCLQAIYTLQKRLHNLPDPSLARILSLCFKPYTYDQRIH